MKKAMSLILGLVLVFTLFTGCAPKAPAATAEAAAPAAEKLKIAATVAVFDDVWLTYMRQAMENELKGYADVEYQIMDAQNDPAKQLAQVENFISSGFQSIIVNPVNTSATKPMTEACQKAGVKLIYLNRMPNDLPEGVYYVGSDSLVAGRLQMEYLAEKAGKKGNIVIMMGEMASEATFNRTDGVKEIAAKFPDMKITKEQTANFNRAEGKTLMENWLATGDQIDVVAANNDEMAIGAIQAIADAGKTGQILVGGVDATGEALKEMEAGTMACTVFQDAEGQGKGAATTAYDLLKGKALEQKVWIPYQLVTPENYKEFAK